MNKEDELYNSLAEDIVRGNSLSIDADWKPWENSSVYEYLVMLQSFEDCSIDRETFCELMERLRRLLVVHITDCPLYVIDFNEDTSDKALKELIAYAPTFGKTAFECQFGYFGMNLPEHCGPYQMILLLHRIKEMVSNNYDGMPLYFFKRNEDKKYIIMFKFTDYQTVMSAVENYKESCSLQLSLMGCSYNDTRETISKVETYRKKIEDYEYEFNARILAEAQARGDYDDVPNKYVRNKPLSEQYVRE